MGIASPVLVHGSDQSKELLVRPVITSEDKVSIQGKLINFGLRYTLRPTVTTLACLYRLPLPWGITDRVTEAIPFGIIDQLARFIMIPPRGTERIPLQLKNCRSEIVRAPGVPELDGTGRAILYLHGGAFLACGLNTHGRLVAEISREARSPVVSVDYRMAPKNQLSKAIDDCVDGYRYLLKAGYSAEQIVIAGDSAGGYLAFMVALTLIAQRESSPAAIVAISPLITFDDKARVGHPNEKTDSLFGPSDFKTLNRILDKANNVSGSGNVKPEPADHDLSEMPPTLIHASASEILLYDAELMVQRLAAAGVPIALKKWQGQAHVFQAGSPVNPEAHRSIVEIGEFIRTATGSLQ
ncbi:MAG: alpha/beta hydrolase [Mycobacteriaceae bacterium]